MFSEGFKMLVRRVVKIFQGVFVCDGKCDFAPEAHFPPLSYVFAVNITQSI